jgi:hypothetical protein
MISFTKEVKKQFGKMSVCILSPIMIPQGRWIGSTVNMVAWSWMQGLPVHQMGIAENMVVHWARNFLARQALDHVCEYTGKKFTHFLWLDADHVFNPDLTCVLARHFLDPNIDAVSALYYSRTGPPLPVVYVKDKNPDPYKHYPLIEVPQALCEVDAFGFGACMMKREIFEKMPDPWFTLDTRGGEDIVFCVHAKQHGFRLFLDGAYRLGHIGEAPIITYKDHERHMQDNKALYADKVRVGLGGKSL